MKYFFVLFSCFLFSCQTKDHDIDQSTRKNNYKDGKIEKEWAEINGKKNGYEFSYYENGNLKSIFYFKNGVKSGEQFWFHENGFLSRKIKIVNNIAMDMAYYFHQSGNLKADRFYKNNKEYSNGVDYWDEPFGVIKYSLHFNDSGNVFYRKNFDTTGKYIGEEGSRP